MNKTVMYGLAAFLALVLVFIGGCSGGANSESGSRQIAQDFIENDTTYVFDGLEDTLKLTNTVKIDNGWQFTYEFDSAHSGYGDRTGEVLAAVITHHVAVITVENGAVTAAVMDDYWDMKNKG